MPTKRAQQAPDVYVTSGWRWTWRQTDVAFWLKMKIGLTSIFDVNIWRWLNVGFWLHNLKTTKSQRQLMSVLDINLTLTLDVGFTLNFGHPTSQPKFNQISTSYDVVCHKTVGPAGTPELYQSCSWLGRAGGLRTMKWKFPLQGIQFPHWGSSGLEDGLNNLGWETGSYELRPLRGHTHNFHISGNKDTCRWND